MIGFLRNLFTDLRNIWSELPHQSQTRIEDLQNGSKPAPQTISLLFELLFQSNSDVSRKAADAIDAIIPHCTARDLIQLDYAMRERSGYRFSEIHPSQVGSLSRGQAGPLGLLSSSRNGRVREAALRELSLFRDGSELPFLLLRLTDWVPPIRELSETAIRDRLIESNIPHFARNLGLLTLLSNRARLGPHIAAAIEILFQSDQGRAALLSQLSSDDRDTRRRASELLIAHNNSPPADVINQLLSSPYPALRVAAASMFRTILAGQPLFDLLTRLLADKSPLVRRQALYGFAERLPDQAAPILQHALLDPSPALREIARFYLGRAGHSDFAPLYRARISPDDPCVRIAIAGLGETGADADAPLIAPFYIHRTPATRRAAIRALGKLAPEPFAQQFLAALRDPSPTVARAARDVLQCHPHLLTPQTLADILDQYPAGATAVIALSLASSLPRWDDLPLYIRATTSSDPRISDFARAHLLSWRYNANRLVVLPTPQQRQALTNALQNPHTLNADLIRELQLAIKS